MNLLKWQDNGSRRLYRPRQKAVELEADMRVRKMTAFVALVPTVGALTLGVASTSIAATQPSESNCKSVDSTYYQPIDPPDGLRGPNAVRPADAGDPGIQSYDLTFKECETRTSKTTMTVKWTWTLHNTARLLDGSVAVYMYNCDTGTASKGQAAMNEPKGTKQSVRSKSGTLTFSVAAAAVHDYRAGFSGAGQVQETGTAAVFWFNADPPNNIIPFRGRTGCY